MSFDDLPKIKPRKWVRDSQAFRTLERAKRIGKFVVGLDGVTKVKIVKEVRWRLFWKQEKMG